uniref:Uncharacterized protein n=1 Tax=Gouania willdenowi TaxID=441366 RepID=A0A8C5GRV2_GOUWI
MAFSSRTDSPKLPDFSMLKRLVKDHLVYLLEQLPGKKDLFIDADLMSPLDRIANVTTLKVTHTHTHADTHIHTHIFIVLFCCRNTKWTNCIRWS